MDAEPLNSDLLAPRYAIESDEEEDEINPLTKSTDEPPVEVEIIGAKDINSKPLIVASGSAGALWSKGACLGEQIGAVNVNGIQVGLLFSPSWTTAVVLVSEVLARLPYSTMYSYADCILSTLKPSVVSLLDQYSPSFYIASAQLPYQQAPIRYIQSNGSVTYSGNLQPFDPPNLIAATSAAFMTLLSQNNCPSTLFLLPCPYAQPPPPKILEPVDLSDLHNHLAEWPADKLDSVHLLLFQTVGEWLPQRWEAAGKVDAVAKPTPYKTKIGDANMYI